MLGCFHLNSLAELAASVPVLKEKLSHCLYSKLLVILSSCQSNLFKITLKLTAK